MRYTCHCACPPLAEGLACHGTKQLFSCVIARNEVTKQSQNTGIASSFDKLRIRDDCFKKFF